MQVTKATRQRPARKGEDRMGVGAGRDAPRLSSPRVLRSKEDQHLWVLHPIPCITLQCARASIGAMCIFQRAIVQTRPASDCLLCPALRPRATFPKC